MLTIVFVAITVTVAVVVASANRHHSCYQQNSPAKKRDCKKSKTARKESLQQNTSLRQQRETDRAVESVRERDAATKHETATTERERQSSGVREYDRARLRVRIFRPYKTYHSLHNDRIDTDPSSIREREACTWRRCNRCCELALQVSAADGAAIAAAVNTAIAAATLHVPSVLQSQSVLQLAV